jgi:hypothetical protein
MYDFNNHTTLSAMLLQLHPTYLPMVPLFILPPLPPIPLLLGTPMIVTDIIILKILATIFAVSPPNLSCSVIPGLTLDLILLALKKFSTRKRDYSSLGLPLVPIMAMLNVFLFVSTNYS